MSGALRRNKNEAWLYHAGNNKLCEESLDARLRKSLSNFNRHFREWLKEMGESNVAFRPL